MMTTYPYLSLVIYPESTTAINIVGIVMKRCVIIGGAPIGNYADVSQYIKADDYCIFCDSGLFHLAHLGVKPALVVGDFDSHEIPDISTEIIQLPCEKDDTDTVYAVKEAVRRGYDEFLLLGMVGARLDHTLGNVSILLYLHSHGKKGILIDDYSEMEIVSQTPVHIDDSCDYFSVLNIWGVVKGLTIENAKYPLQNAEISPQYQYGISNEVLPGKIATVSVLEGCALLIKIKNPLG